MDRPISILGTPYRIHYVDYADDPYLTENNLSGYCDCFTKSIVVANAVSLPDHDKTTSEADIVSEKAVLRHEIVHAFLNESGLQADSYICGIAWALNEEMVDWFALQGPKIIKAWQEADAL